MDTLFSSFILLLGLSFVLSQSVSESRSIKIVFAKFLDYDNTTLFVVLITCFLVRYLVTAVPKKRIETRIEKIESKLVAFSYSSYLTHYPLMYLLSYYGFPKSERVNIQSISLYFLELITGLAVSFLIYLVSEKHTYKIKNIIKARL